MQRNDRVFDIIRRTAVVVNDRDLVDRLQQRLALDIAGTVDACLLKRISPSNCI